MPTEKSSDPRVTTSWWTLRLVYGLIPIVAGADKLTNLLTDWTQYLSPFMRGLLPFAPETFMHIVGVIEIAAGVLVLTRLTRIGAYVVSAWLVGIALALLTGGKCLDVAARDVAMAAGAFVLARLSEVRGTASERLIAATPARAVP